MDQLINRLKSNGWIELAGTLTHPASDARISVYPIGKNAMNKTVFSLRTYVGIGSDCKVTDGTYDETGLISAVYPLTIN